MAVHLSIMLSYPLDKYQEKYPLPSCKVQGGAFSWQSNRRVSNIFPSLQKRKRSFRKSSFGYFPFKESNARPARTP